MVKKIDTLPIIFGVLLIAFVAPLVLIPLEKLLPYPHIFEELFKAGLILFILKLPSKMLQLKITLLVGLFFAFSENVFYLANFITNGIIVSFWRRMVLTTAVHILTTTVILLPSQKKRAFIMPATIVAILIHFLYNQLALVLF